MKIYIVLEFAYEDNSSNILKSFTSQENAEIYAHEQRSRLMREGLAGIYYIDIEVSELD